MKLPNVSFVVLALAACFFTGIAKKAQPRSELELVNKYKTSYPETYQKMQDDVRNGTVKALDTCRESFKNERWNCDVNKTKVLVHRGKKMPAFAWNSLPANREGAYLQALGSASAMYTLTKNCRLGRYEDCACVPVNRPFANRGKDWRWYGCNANLQFGETMTKHFIDSLEDTASDLGRAALNLHNNEVGRQVVKTIARMRCKCYGSTGSCYVKGCWTQLQKFTWVEKILKKKYNNAIRVKYTNNTIEPLSDTGGVQLAKRRQAILAYFDKSPNYCLPDNGTGYPGMRGRKCDHGNDGAHKCNLLCTSCGLKFRNDVIVKREKCRCKMCVCYTCEKQYNVTICL